MLLGSVSALNLSVTSPEDGGVYNSSSLYFELASDEYSDFFFLKNASDASGHWLRLCKDAMECEKRTRFSEGENSIAIRAISDDGVIKTEGISFFVDSKKPMIRKTSPARNSFVNQSSDFVVVYTEENVRMVVFRYWTDSERMRTIEQSCPSGKDVECVFSLPEDIESNGEMHYWFEVIDKAGNNKTTMQAEVYIDTTAPKLISFENQTNRRRVKFVIELEEENLEEVYYVDKNEFNPQNEKLCSRLRYGRCTATKSFKSGAHNLDIIAVDKAGNSVMVKKDFEFSV